MTDLWKLDAVAVADLTRSRKVSSREVTQSVLDRLDAINPTINAVVRPLHEEALAAADAADRAAAEGKPLGPLHGVPVTTKINLDQTGCPTDNGVVAFKDLMASQDNPTIANLRRAGAIIVGRTNTPAFSMRWFTDNALHGLTLNPWDRTRTAGGSSGGAASATAAGIGAIGQGNDIAGSVRYPAYCCGIVGLRPTYARIPGHNFTSTAKRSISSQLMAVQGPLTRSVRDARVALAAMSAGDANDPRWVDVPLEGPRPAAPIRVAMVVDPAGRGGIAPEIAAAVRQAARWLEEAGYRVEEVEPPEFGTVIDLWAKLAMDDVIAALEPAVDKWGDDGIKTAIGLWRAVHPPADPRGVLDALAERDRLLRLWQLFLEERPLILTHTSAELPFEVGRDLIDAPTTARLMQAQSTQLAVPVLGLPAASVPTGTVGRVPVGVQLIAGRYREDVCLDAAEAIERRAGVLTPVGPAG
ncbi:amidase family protein [Reyranella sp. CPCC 100927]|uniref:amidase family protein n=1 Tax=Reyranella sp. CPCC 100927 TaxID=2599616 RepID=UPI0011B5A1E7|nr:amidase family protein [Reyranella sp. CPCC 100927]TWT10864.1 amidase [Reyranella sp. CPCC 100927]